MWVWDQSAGTMTRNGKLIAKGYSGFAAGKNNPALQGKVAVGPIPAGLWKIGTPYNSQNTGPFTIILEPVGHNALGRSAFRIHGDSAKAPGTASRGCIILPRPIRELIWNSGDRQLKVVH